MTPVFAGEPSAGERCADEAAALPLIAVVGPTGTGKSDLAIDLALEIQRCFGPGTAEIINADASQFYAGMDIGTAKVPLAERGGVPHHFLGHLDLRDEASVAEFQQHARERIALIRSRGAVPILCGGSGLYVRAVLDEIRFPGTDPEIRARLEDECEREGSAGLRARLREADPVSEARIHDDRRLIRALEVLELTGEPFSSFMPERRYEDPHTVQIGLRVEPQRLRELLETRVHRMAEQGLVDEVQSLIPQGLLEGRTSSRAIGYAQIAAHLAGEMSMEEAVAETVVLTHKLAKRQRTWFGGDPRVAWIDVDPDLPGDERRASVLAQAMRIISDSDAPGPTHSITA